MKKVLLATTVLAMTATVAAAEVKLSGNARMGVVYNGDAVSNKLQFSSRVRATISMSGETDSGLAFGGEFGVHDAGPASNGSAGSVFISGAFGKLTMGDVVGAAEEVVGNLPEVGFQDLSGGLALNASDNDTLFLTGDGAFYPSATNPGALYTYSTGGLTFALGMNDGATNAGGIYAAVDGVQAYSVGVKYAVDGYSVSLGYEVADPTAGPSAKHLIVGGEATFGTTTVKAFYGDGSGTLASLKHYGIGVTHKVDALTVKGYVKKTEIGGASATGYGIGADYALGGGATLSGGIVDNNVAGSKIRADLGIKFSF
ncbi:MAG: porin [Pseudotabrizicola sp.]|uniref:porin n=1 Tax=Pseudotabrizicola sp. TaxID=2939647 RepID=UPI00273201C6|nr:porin [Pseudotabrizicola sp.]MDP2082447.1 porin [Pseudotabrizicola sp.]MDZ7574200.1 porin [Pseudotabrizicola sp.]